MQHLIVLTRPEAKNDDLAFSLQALFAQENLSSRVQIISVPALQILPYTWSELSSLAKTDFLSLVQFDTIFCVSPIAIELFFDLLKVQGITLPLNIRFLCVGTGSQEQLLKRGVVSKQIIMAERGNDSESLLKAMQIQQLILKKLLIVRAETGRDLLKESLQSQGVDVHVHAVYRRERAVLTSQQRNFLENLSDNTSIQWLFTSSESVKALLPALHEIGLFTKFLNKNSLRIFKNHQFWVIHQRVAEAIINFFIENTTIQREDIEQHISVIDAKNMQIQEAMLKHIHNMG